MGLKGITVNTAAEAEAHIYAEDDAAIYQSILGMDAVADMENMKIVRSRTDRPERTEMI